MSPPSERTAEEWGRVAVSLPGWRWMPGMRAMLTAEGYGPVPASPARLDDLEVEAYQGGGEFGQWPDPDDPATAGCLLALLGPYACSLHDAEGWMAGVGSPAGAKFRVTHSGSSLGRACIAAAEAIGRWPGGDL